MITKFSLLPASQGKSKRWSETIVVAGGKNPRLLIRHGPNSMLYPLPCLTLLHSDLM